MLDLIKNMQNSASSLEIKFFTFVFPVFLYLAIFLYYCCGYSRKVAVYNIKSSFILLKRFVVSDHFWSATRVEFCVPLVESILMPYTNCHLVCIVHSMICCVNIHVI